MAVDSINIGMKYESLSHIEERITLPYFSPTFTGFSYTPPLFLAVFIVAVSEAACINFINTNFGPEQKSVAIAVSLHICAPLTIGTTLRTSVELVRRTGARLDFEFLCCDGSNLVAQGQHKRDLML